MIGLVMGMVSTRALSHCQFAVLTFVHMFVHFYRAGSRMACDSDQAVGPRVAHRADDRPEHDRDQNQPPHAQRDPGRVRGAWATPDHGVHVSFNDID